MPEHMKRREAVYYFRRVVPKDLQAAGQPGKSADHSRQGLHQAKEWLHVKNVRFDQWVAASAALASRSEQMPMSV